MSEHQRLLSCPQTFKGCPPCRQVDTLPSEELSIRVRPIHDLGRSHRIAGPMWPRRTVCKSLDGPEDSSHVSTSAVSADQEPRSLRCVVLSIHPLITSEDRRSIHDVGNPNDFGMNGFSTRSRWLGTRDESLIDELADEPYAELRRTESSIASRRL